jgi:hypothetical protein
MGSGPRTNFELFEKYPHYVFKFSGANRYRMIKEYYPGSSSAGSAAEGGLSHSHWTEYLATKGWPCSSSPLA